LGWINVLFLSAAVAAQEALPVTVMPVVRIAIAEEVALTGNLVARRVSNLSAEVDGIVKDILVDDGSVVTTGQKIVVLDTDIAEIDRRVAAASVAEAEATLKEAVRRHRELERLKDQSHTSLTSVEAALAQISIQEASHRQALSNLARTETLLRKHQVNAPFAGIVSRKLVEVGQWVDTNTPLVELIDTHLLRLEIPVPQYYFQAVRVGTPAQIRFDALPQQPIESGISAVIPISDTASRTFRARIDIPNATGKLAPGMTAKATLRLTKEKESASIVASRDAIVRKPNGDTSIWMIEEIDGVAKAKPVNVSVGRSYRGGVEILSGNLPVGSLAVVRGNEILRPGQSVRVATKLSPQY
ncbi:MAG: efflux RND transporter periplasmic adaptor subunit, partial [Gammaproteobacteria bacterium]